MKELFRKYYEMNSEEKDEIEDLFILHKLKNILENNKELEFNISEEEILFETVKDCMKYSNKTCEEIIFTLLNVLKDVNITVYQIENLGKSELLDLLDKDDNRFETKNLGLNIVIAFRLDDYYCVLFKKDKGYTLIYENDDCIQYQDDFNNLKEFIGCFVKYRLEERVKKVV